MVEDIDDDEDFEDIDDENVVETVEIEDDGLLLDDQDDIDDAEKRPKSLHNARRRLEQLREDKELERLISGDFYDWG